MDALVKAQGLSGAGRFAEAMAVLERGPASQDRAADKVLEAELLERLGKPRESQVLAESLLKSRKLSSSNRAACEYVLGRIEAEHGRFDAAIVRLHTAIRIARQAGDLERVCWSQLRLLLIVADRSGYEAAVPLIAALRLHTTKIGSPHLSAALRLFIGQLEAMRGLVRSALHHTRIARGALVKWPNRWLEAMADNTELAVAVIRSDYEEGLSYGRRSVEEAEQSGSAVLRRACLANVGNLLYCLGRYDEATEHYLTARALLPSGGDGDVAILSSIAEVHLTEGRLAECESLLNEIEEALQQPGDRMIYAHRHNLLIRARLLDRRGRLDEALAVTDDVIRLATAAKDDLLVNRAHAVRADIRCRRGDVLDGMAGIERLLGCLDTHPDLYAVYERLFACALASTGEVRAGRAHFERSRLIYESLGNAPALADLHRSWEHALARGMASMAPEMPSADPAPSATRVAVSAGTVLQAAASLLLHACRPELLAREIVQILADTDCVQHAAAVSRGRDDSVEMLAITGEPQPLASVPSARRLAIGVARGRDVEVLVGTRPGLESVATVNAILLLLATIHELENARAEREDRLTLWPADDVGLEGVQAVVSGQMRDVMASARRVAGTNVTVLISGESGTGKEVVARAIHSFSARAHKPFVAFNCTTVPRDMLESQLFGHRRGAFTGADRDAPGLIRSARDGTVFLDEIGDLALDMQPKLLRFLESGEICPLGETPTTVDVRIIAATNADLEQLVADGRFREDLFYRLNVIPLRVPPLRERRDEIAGLVNHFLSRATEEFGKGHTRLAEETAELLLLYSWPGNVRQLQNEIRRMVALAEHDEVISPDALSDKIRAARTTVRWGGDEHQIIVPLRNKLMPTLARVEREMIQSALREHPGVEGAAHALGISRKGLYLKRQRLGL